MKLTNCKETAIREDEIVWRPYITITGKKSLRKRNKTKENASSLAWYYRNKEYANKLALERRHKNIDRYRDYARRTWKNRTLKHRYGIGEEDFNKLVILQNNSCAICGEKFVGIKKPCIDHCHKNSNIRGILCKKCNMGIGHFNDSVEILKKAIIYLEKSYVTNIS